jgi:hypothetical protein
MHEHILARGTLDESVTLGSVKPLDSTFLSHDLLLSPGLLGINPCLADVPRLNPEEQRLGKRLNVCRETRVAAPLAVLAQSKKAHEFVLTDSCKRVRADPWNPCKA